MKRQPTLIWLASGLALTLIPLTVFLRTSASYSSLSTVAPRLARMGDRATLHAAGRGTPRINFADGREVLTAYAGDPALQQLLEQNLVQPLAMASGDFDEDGMPDLISAYAGPSSGVLTLHRGNVDAIYPNTPEANSRKAQGAFTDAPFLSPACLLGVPVPPDFIGAGDFDADGHLDLAAAARGGHALYLLAGNGNGGFGSPESIELPGAVTAMETGEVNRRDGLADLIIGIITPAGPQVLIFQNATGALRAAPESFALRDAASDFALGQFDSDGLPDLAIAAGHNLMVVYGRDREASPDAAKPEAPRAFTSRQSFPFTLQSLVTGDFTAEPQANLAALSGDGAVYLLNATFKKQGNAEQAKESLRWKTQTLAQGTWSGSARLLKAKVSSLPQDDLLVIDSSNRQLRIIETGNREPSGQQAISSSGGRGTLVDIEVEDEPVAALPMRLNADALNDLVILRKHNVAPSAVTTQSAMTFTVINNADNGVGSLRQAIIDANANPGADTIIFMDGSGPQTINLTSPLPTITEAVTIDGTTQPGFMGNPIVELNGAGAGALTNGLNIIAGNSTVRGLVINRFSGDSVNGNGIYIRQKGTCVVEGNFIGTNAGGTSALGNTSQGVRIEAAADNTVGGTVAAARNLISGNNASGVLIFLAGATNNTVQGNFIGTNVTGTAAVPNARGGVIVAADPGPATSTIGGTVAGAGNLISGNTLFGVRLATSSNQVQGNLIGTTANGLASLPNGNGNGIEVTNTGGSNATNNLIGGTVAAARNIISGNTSSGVSFTNNSASNQVQGNFIGTDLNGTAVIGNGLAGVSIASSSSSNTIGGTAASMRNIISGNGAGCLIQGLSTNNTLQGNFVGTDVTGNVALGNTSGIIVGGSTGSTIGGTTAGAGNLISGNAGNGVGIAAGSGNTTVQGNFIGTNAAGTAAIPNAGRGVYTNSPTTTIGGTAAGARNIISGNAFDGVVIDSTTGNQIQGNFIGTDVTGTAAIPNASGVRIDSSTSTTVGGTTAAARNVISGNNGTGILLIGTATGNQVQGNFIGTNASGNAALANSQNGVALSGGSSNNNNIGGIGAGNTIAFNGAAGVVITAGTGNAALSNSIFSNGGLGIDLSDDGGVTPNDLCDGDSGANNLQNFPVLTSASSTGGNTTIVGTLNSTQNTIFRIEFFSSTACDGSGNGEGQVFIGSTSITTPASGCDAVIAVTLSVAVPVGNVITATATDPSNNTSEFSHCVVVMPAACTITCPANLTKSNVPNQCGAPVDYAPPTTSGACGTVTCSPVAGSFFPVGTTVVNCTTAAGPSCTFTVTVNDTQAPTITCPANITQGTASNQCSAVVAYPAPTVSDNCPGVGVPACNPPAGSSFPKGMTAVNCNVSDASGNTANCSFTVTINDTTPPTITCPPNQSVTSNVPAVVNYPAPTAADNCPGVTSGCAPPSGSLFAIGTTTVTCTATDTSGNTASCNFTVTVAPCIITCPQNVIARIGTNATTCGGNVSYPPPNVSAGCGPATCNPASGSFFNVGTTIVTCSIPGGSNCSFAVIVLDEAAPRITCPNSIVTAPLPGQSSAVVNYPAATATDNCPGTTVQCSPPSGSRFPLGTTFVTCTAVDSSSNSAACVFSVIVIDSEPPVINCPANVTAGTQSGQTSAVVNYPPPNVTDNTGVVTTVCVPASGSSFPLGVTTVTCTATDLAGNKSSCSFIVGVGGPQAKVTIPGNKTSVEFATVPPTRKPPKPKNRPCSLFTIENIGFAPLVLTFDSLKRTGSDVTNGRITDPNDISGIAEIGSRKFFVLYLVNSDQSLTPLGTGAVLTLQHGLAQPFCVEFAAFIPGLAGKTTGLAASDVLPDLVTSTISFRQNAGANIEIPILARVGTGVVLIDPANPRKPPVVTFTRSGNDITVSYAVFDSNLDVSRAKYEFLGSSGQVIGSAFEIDLTEQLRALGLVRGQSFAVEQRFTGASDHPEIVGVRVTVFDGETSATNSASAASVTTASIQLLNSTGDARLYLPVVRLNAPLP